MRDRQDFSFSIASVFSATACITTTLDAVSKTPHSPVCIFSTSPPLFPFLYPSSSPPPCPPITLSPRWLWGRPVWNVIGIIPFSLIASAGEKPYVSHRVPTQPLRTHYTHISHRNLLKAESNMCAYTPTCMHGRAGVLRITCTALQGPCAVLCLFFLTDKWKTETLISFSLKNMLVGVWAQSALVQTRQRSQTTM